MSEENEAKLTLIDKIKQNKHFQEFSHPETRKKFYKYLVVGFSSVGLEMSLFIVFRDLLHIPNPYYNGFASAIIFVYNFFLNRQWAFQSSHNIFKQLLIYTPLFLFNIFAVNMGLFWLLTEKVFKSELFINISFMPEPFDIKGIIIKCFLIGLIVMWNFVIYKKFIYKH